jgi:predicted house-cleaning noncanonical NTP pyrophosphatase (MazG superfamily)
MITVDFMKSKLLRMLLENYKENPLKELVQQGKPENVAMLVELVYRVFKALYRDKYNEPEQRHFL